jgi:hypothetical protein
MKSVGDGVEGRDDGLEKRANGEKEITETIKKVGFEIGLKQGGIGVGRGDEDPG